MIKLKAVAASSKLSSSIVLNQDIPVFGLIDGFGAYTEKNTEEVSQDIQMFLKEGLSQDCEVTLPFVFRSYLTSHQNLIFNALIFANDNLLLKNKKISIQERFAANVSCAVLQKNILSISVVGSTAVFLLRDNSVTLLNRPKSYYQLFSPDFNCKVLEPKSLNFPLSAIGMFRELEPELLDISLVENDLLLMMNEGAYSHLNNNDLTEFYSQLQHVEISKENLTIENQKLLNKINEKGAENSTIISISY